MPATLGKTRLHIFMLSIFIFIVIPQATQAQCTSSGSYNPGTSVSASYAGSSFSFSNTGNSLLSDNSRSSASALVGLLNGKTEHLKSTGFNFSIPLSALICGIEVQVEKRATGIGQILFLESYVTDYDVRLVKGGTVTGNNKATATHWTGTDAYYTYGSNNDLWGTTWLPAEINAANFGIAFAADAHGLISGLVTLLPNIEIDHVRITVFYLDIVLPLRLLNFAATPLKNNTVLLQWETGEQNDYTKFDIQNSPNGADWETVQEVSIEAGTKNARSYKATHKQPLPGKSYYRLKMTTTPGEVYYSESKSVLVDKMYSLKVYPNPFIHQVQLTGVQPGDKIVLFDALGRIVLQPKQPVNGNILQLNLAALKPGTYILAVAGKRMKIQKL